MISAPEDVPGSTGVKGGAAAALLLVALAALPGARAAPGDSTTELATGGLVLGKSPDIEMRAQDLFISQRQIRVGYRFYNGTPGEVKAQVAFPMPDVTIADAAAGVPIPTEDAHNLLDFATRVDGVPVNAQVAQKVFARGVDRTADLHRLKVPLAPHLRATDKALSKLPPGDGDDLKRMGLAGSEDFGVGRGMRKQLSPRWTLKTTYLWEQTFPAGREVAVEHSYKPSVGRSAFSPLRNPEAMRDVALKEYARKYCVDKDFIAAIERARQSARSQDGGAPFSEERISYLLAAEAGGAGPIGEFRLIVDKGDPGNLVAFCADGIKQIGPTQYEVRKTGYRPTGDLHVLILKRSRR